MPKQSLPEGVNAGSWQGNARRPIRSKLENRYRQPVTQTVQCEDSLEAPRRLFLLEEMQTANRSLSFAKQYTGELIDCTNHMRHHKIRSVNPSLHSPSEMGIFHARCEFLIGCDKLFDNRSRGLNQIYLTAHLTNFKFTFV